MSWKNILNLFKEGGRDGKAVSKASLKDGVKDPTEVGRKHGASEARYKDSDGNVFKDSAAKQAESKRRQDSIPDEVGHQTDIELVDRGDQEGREHDDDKKFVMEALRRLRSQSRKKLATRDDDELQVER